jgi:hypothetical protein
LCEIILSKRALTNKGLVTFIFFRLPSFIVLPLLNIVFYYFKIKFINNQINKRNGTLELIESVISTYNQISNKKNKKQLSLLNFHKKFNKRLELILLKYKLQLYLLRNLLYRILNKCLTQSNIRKLIKMEILKAPERTFSDFINLYGELRAEQDSMF